MYKREVMRMIVKLADDSPLWKTFYAILLKNY